MHPRTDLSLLLESLNHLSTTPYFNKAIDGHRSALVDVINHVQSASPSYDEDVVRSLAEKIWTSHRYLHGSTTKEAPYEIGYCMKHAIDDWLPGRYILTTALTDEKDFHLKVDDPWAYIRVAVDRFGADRIPLDKLIFIGVPRIYKHMPLFCAALYHELGHYVDVHLNIVDTTLLDYPPEAKLSPQAQQIVANHRREFFADLFAACYVGSGIVNSLNDIDPNSEATYTHPPTATRIEVIRAFLAGEQFDELTMFQETLAKLKLPLLEQKFEVPPLEVPFDDIRPCSIQNTAQLHGIISGGWSYMAKLLQGEGPKWASGAAPLEIIRMINDLVEKSIRNASVRQLWLGSPV